ncbi:MAG: hypothetical protein EOO05_18320 [Chitinophagaceae bacterium]|nr:MAG: hypothetical protein EOO05_18320 [Chitinophagaceae bacterium]
MIHFRAQPVDTAGERKTFGQIMASKLADNLNRQELYFDCPYHPGSMALIDVLPTVNLKFEIAVCCCPDFGGALQNYLNEAKKDMKK